MRPLNVLIGMEFSGIVREAFRRRGHNAFSCDVLDAEDGSPYHLQGDIKYALAESNGFFFPQLGGHTRWDLGIFHPPCTRLTNAGRGTVREPKKWEELYAGAALFELCLGRTGTAKLQELPRRAVENPIMHEHAAALINRPPDQIIQPWMFGRWETKALCYWLTNLPNLVPAYPTIEECREALGLPVGSKPEAKVWKMPPGPKRQELRSESFIEVAEAMARQWG
jgi:hypothetical protein